MNEYPNRIPYDTWTCSQLSVARYYGGIELNGKMYRIEKGTGDLVHTPKQPRKRKPKP